MSTTNHVIQDSPGVFTVRPSSGFQPINSVGVVPAEIPFEDWRFITATEGQYGEYVISVDEAKKAEALAAKQVEDDSRSAYQALETDIYDEMYKVFGTRRADTANADYETWKDMKVNASKYSGLGLKVRSQVDDSSGVELFSPGSALDTDGKIISYATRKVEQAEEYAVYRIKRKQEFMDSKS